MEPRQYTPGDRLLEEISRTINVLAAPARSARPYPARNAPADRLSATERVEAARLMRVNHSGEIAAQALYRGQALWARKPRIAQALRQAATEEMDHLAWCEERLGELGGRPSVLAPVWYGGSFLIGWLAGAAGDAASLGFVSETERQVESHLEGSMQKLPVSDQRSRSVLAAMAADEAAHGTNAEALGGKPLPTLIKTAMKWTARIMTRTSFWL